jgi:hypothetical protein
LWFGSRAETRGKPFRDKRVEAGEHYYDFRATRQNEGVPASSNDAVCIILCYSEFVTISLRNLPKEVEKAILETSHREGISLNKATLRLLEAQLRRPAKNSDFEEFCGTWSSAEADAFDAALVEMRQVDPADWESAG